MFGEKLIFGEKEMSMDEKGRIILPKFTYAEEKDEVAFIYPEAGDYIRIFLYQKVEALFNRMVDKQINTKDLKLMKDIQNTINNLNKLCAGTATLDKQRRVLIPEDVRNKLELNTNVQVVGATDIIYMTDTMLGDKNLSLPCVKIYKA